MRPEGEGGGEGEERKSLLCGKSYVLPLLRTDVAIGARDHPPPSPFQESTPPPPLSASRLGPKARRHVCSLKRFRNHNGSSDLEVEELEDGGWVGEIRERRGLGIPGDNLLLLDELEECVQEANRKRYTVLRR